MTNLPSFKMRTTFFRACVVLLGIGALLVPSLRAATILDYSAGNNSGSTTPGLQLVVPTIADPNQSAWALTSFTWLSTSSTSANETGRGFISVFDALLYNPAGKSASQVNSDTTGLMGRSATYDTVTGAYLFTNVNLESGKTYYFLNSNAMSTTLSPAAPYEYGFSTSASVSGVTRWVVSSGAWASQAGAPNFSVTLDAVPVPEPAASGFFALALLALAFRKQRA
jgi:hypothetical protein